MGHTKTTLAQKLDKIVRTESTWDVLVKQANTAAKRMGFGTKFTVGTLRAHINYRIKTQKKADFLGDLQMSEAGIVKVATE
jgi:hypothetical protein